MLFIRASENFTEKKQNFLLPQRNAFTSGEITLYIRNLINWQKPKNIFAFLLNLFWSLLNHKYTQNLTLNLHNAFSSFNLTGIN